MKSLFSDNRSANILQLFRRTPVISVSTLAAKLNVSERTVRNDIRQLNEDLKECAEIIGDQGKYSLRIFNIDGFRDFFAKMMEEDNFLNSPRNRMDYAFGKLMRTEEPLLTDELAYEMNISRTTLIADMKKLRSEISPYHLEIVGQTSKGMSLRGQESDIRKYILGNSYEQIYGEYPLDKEIIDVIARTFLEYSFEKTVKLRFVQYITLMLDRFLTGHYIGVLSGKYYNLTFRQEFEIVDRLMNEISKILHVEFPVEEKLYVLLPIVGMRTPADAENMQKIKLDEEVRGLMQKILRQIRLETDITIVSGEFTDEFLYHLMFMLNRLRFGVCLTNPMLDDLKGKYPLAYELAGIAASVIGKEYDLEVSEDERGYLASYFGVFLTENDLKRSRKFRVAVVCGTGRVTARLVAAQLKKILDSSAEMTLFADENVDSGILEEFDVVLTTVNLPCSCKRPVIRIHEIFNERELLHKIEKAKYLDRIEVPVVDNNWFVMAGLLEEGSFFVLDENMTYEDAVYQMVEELKLQEKVDAGFWERLKAREQKGTMVFDRAVAIPHSIQYKTDRLSLAIGVSDKPIRYQEQEIRIIFLLGLPEKIDMDDSLLIRLYDEIISISQDEEMLDKIAGSGSFYALLRAMYRQVKE
ncbi:MAG: PRD domain-containing protein [Eubacteriales bacterium]|nr:PRD domain-containing protein [Eubacteriales bacterium]